jgi:hypothetical protein
MPSQSPALSISSKTLLFKKLIHSDFDIPVIPDVGGDAQSVFLGEFDFSPYTFVIFQMFMEQPNGNAGPQFKLITISEIESVNVPVAENSILKPGQGTTGTFFSQLVFSRIGNFNYTNVNTITSSAITGIQATDPNLKSVPDKTNFSTANSSQTIIKLYMLSIGIDAPRSGFTINMSLTGII